jgi:hypothetical protein
MINLSGLHGAAPPIQREIIPVIGLESDGQKKTNRTTTQGWVARTATSLPS